MERTLAPLLHDGVSPDEILALRVCDPAMGSGAFLVEACRQLAAHLVRAWERTGAALLLPALPTRRGLPRRRSGLVGARGRAREGAPP